VVDGALGAGLRRKKGRRGRIERDGEGWRFGTLHLEKVNAPNTLHCMPESRDTPVACLLFLSRELVVSTPTSNFHSATNRNRLPSTLAVFFGGGEGRGGVSLTEVNYDFSVLQLDRASNSHCHNGCHYQIFLGSQSNPCAYHSRASMTQLFSPAP